MSAPYISTSVFELLKAGPGPSSSHTIGPMRAGADFTTLVQGLDPQLKKQAAGLRVRFWGSLSATGRGHGSDRAVIAGLMGYEPDRCPPALLNDLESLPAAERALKLDERRLPLDLSLISYGPIQHERPYSNTLMIDLLDCLPDPASGGYLPIPPMTAAEAGPDSLAAHILFSKEYYSVGGGFIQWPGWEPPERGLPPYPYGNMRELLIRLEESGLSLDRLMLLNESALTGASEEKIRRDLDHLLGLMKDAVERGCRREGRLPGSIGLRRKAPALYRKAEAMNDFDRHLSLLNAYAYAAAEENAAGNIIVTAPTCGSAGVIPALAVFMEKQLGLDQQTLRGGLLAASVAGFIAKQNAGIAGAEVGCQGEIGVASAMAAAMLAHGRGCPPKMVENAAEIALEHHLGLTCDPVGGYVQIPCIERNAMGAVKAYNAALIAAHEDPAAHLVGYDDSLKAMLEIGRDMNSKYKETSTGGLAVCLAEC